MPRKPRTKNRSGAGDSKRRDRGTCPPSITRNIMKGKVIGG
jgi:hypothetical protein